MPKPIRTPAPGPTPEMLGAAVAAHLADLHYTLSLRTFNISDEDNETAVYWLAEQVIAIWPECRRDLG